MSVDIGIAQEDYSRRAEHLASVISSAIKDSVGYVERSEDTRLEKIAFEALTETLHSFCESYEAVTVGSAS